MQDSNADFEWFRQKILSNNRFIEKKQLILNARTKNELIIIVCDHLGINSHLDKQSIIDANEAIRKKSYSSINTDIKAPRNTSVDRAMLSK